jgi:histidine triad (HIT) family protein
MALQPGCIFCQILSGDAEASVVYKDELVTAFMDTKPLVRGHLLIIPNEHLSSLAELEEPFGSRMFIVARQLAKAIQQSRLRAEGVNFFLADGAAAGQTVFHSHLHVIPRFTGDGFKIRFPVGYGHRPARKDLNEIAAMLQKVMDPPNDESFRRSTGYT